MANSRGAVLVVDDEQECREALAALLDQEGYPTLQAASGEDALEILGGSDVDVVLTDLRVATAGAVDLIEQGKERAPHATFVVMTAAATLDGAVEAIKKGAEQYLTKPIDSGAVLALVERAVARAQLSREAAGLRQQLRRRRQFKHILGDHPSMQQVLSLVEQVARSRATVLIYGESGTGKELIASAIHYNSERHQGPFVKLNCAALAESLLESELFGHEKGAYTGALARREGRLKQADGGTLLLDEVGEMPPALQVKLLRFLQEREFERVGGNVTLRVDVRVVAATNRELRERIQQGRFREDLFFRLNVVEIDVPPLRARPSDIPVLAQHFVERFASENERAIRSIASDAMDVMLSYPWPGNVRELENAMERAVVLCSGDTIELEHLPPITKKQAKRHMSMMAPGMTMAEIERMAILHTLEAVGGSPTKAAETLGISRRTIQYRLKEWGMIKSRPKANGSDPPPSSDEPTGR